MIYENCSIFGGHTVRFAKEVTVTSNGTFFAKDQRTKSRMYVSDVDAYLNIHQSLKSVAYGSRKCNLVFSSDDCEIYPDRKEPRWYNRDKEKAKQILHRYIGYVKYRTDYVARFKKHLQRKLDYFLLKR